VTPRGELTSAVLAAAAAGACGLLAGARPWVDLQVLRDAPLPPAAVTVAGATVAPIVPGLALVVLAAAAGLLATRHWGRVAVGAVVTLAGVALLLAALPWLAGVSPARAEQLAADVQLAAGTVSADGRDGPYLAVLAAVLTVATGLVTVLRSRRWPAMGARYDAPTARPTAAGPQAVPDGPVGVQAADPAAPPAASDRADAATSDRADAATSDRAVWDALDRGEDPTLPGR